jgi:hypothetical protein
MTSAIKFFEEGGDPNVSAQRDSCSFQDELSNAHSFSVVPFFTRCDAEYIR